MNDLISIIVPVYNVEDYLSKCIESIINQSYKKIECILVNDGSTDSSLKICNEYCKIDSRIRIIDKTNGGLSSARNAGLDVCTGKYVCFVDSDDWIHVDFVKVLYETLLKYNTKISCCGRFKVYNDKMIEYPTVEKCINSEEALKKLFLYDGMDSAAWDKMYETELFKNIRYPNGKLYEDIPTTYRLIINSGFISFCSGAYYYYLQRNNGICRSPFSERKEDLINNVKIVYDYINANNIKLIHYAEIFYIRNLSNLLMEMPHNYKRRKFYFKSFKREWKKALNDDKFDKKEKIKLLFVRFHMCWLYNFLKKIRN